jgi:acyl-CoA dehydrogenase
MTAIDVPRPGFMDSEELRIFGGTVDRFLDEYASPVETARWRSEGSVQKDVWLKAGQAGLLGLSIPEAYGGAGADFRYEALLIERMGLKHALNFAIPLHNAVVAPYLVHFASEEQKRRWLPDVVTGRTILAIAMTEPGSGSDLQAMKTSARPDGDHYVVNGQKTFISNGLHASLIIVAAKTDSTAGARGISLFVVDTGNVEGFSRGRLLKKLGQEGRDTTELFFNDMRVPAENLLGGVEGRGFAMLMENLPQERMVIAWQAMGMIEAALEVTLAYVHERRAFGSAVIEFQNTQFVLAECKTQATIAKVFLYHCTQQLLAGALDAVTASMAKYWITEVQAKIVDVCLQCFGGYGYMLDYPISEMYKDARGYRIYGGSNEIMKLIIARSL